MATKLKNLNITKVDFVDAGANQRANILLFKRDATKGGESVPEKNPVKKIVDAIAKAIGWPAGETEEALTAIAKDGAKTFNEELATVEVRQIMDEIWDMSDAYRSSLCSIMRDEATADKKTLMLQTTEQFNTAIKGCIERWAAKQSSEVAKSIKRPEMSPEEEEIAKTRAKAIIAKAEDGEAGDNEEDVEPDNPDKDGRPKTTPKKGEPDAKKVNKSESEETDMKINKSLLTPEELKFLEEIEKKAGTDAEAAGAAETADNVSKGASTHTPTETTQESNVEGSQEDVFKGLPTAVVDIIKNLQAKAEAAEDRELYEVAKKYEILGTKAEDLVPVLKGLKQNQGQYEKTIALLDSAVAATAGTFAEIGKKGSQDNLNGSAWDKIEKKAAEIRKSEPSIGYHEAIDKACVQNPELVAEYEQSR